MYRILSTYRKYVLEQITGVRIMSTYRKYDLEQITGVPYIEYRP